MLRVKESIDVRAWESSFLVSLTSAARLLIAIVKFSISKVAFLVILTSAARLLIAIVKFSISKVANATVMLNLSAFGELLCNAYVNETEDGGRPILYHCK